MTAPAPGASSGGWRIASVAEAGCAVCGAFPRSRAEKCSPECPMTAARAALMEIVKAAIETASLSGAFDYHHFAAAMMLRAPDAWATERFCVRCGMPAGFATGWSGKEGREGVWTCFEHSEFAP